MNKKIIKFLLPLTIIFALPTLSSCGEKPFTGKVHLDYGDYATYSMTLYNEESYKFYISDHDELESMINAKESFIFVLYKSTSCSCWQNFLPILNNYINETHTRVYISKPNLFKGYDDKGNPITLNKYGLYTADADMPSIALFNRGKLVYQTVYNKDPKEPFTSLDGLKAFMNSHSIAPKLFWFDSPNELDSLITTSVEFNLYITKASCPDCTRVNKYIRKWIDSKDFNPTVKMYILDIEPFVGTLQYQEYKDKYGLSTAINPNLGWDSGFVPTFQNRTGNTINDMITVYNDNATNDVIDNTYFTESRKSHLSFLEGHDEITSILQGVTFKNFDSKKSDYESKYHDPIIKLFFDTYIK